MKTGTISEVDYSKITKFFTVTATNLSDVRRKVNFLSEFGLNDKEIIYSCNGDEEWYYHIMKEIEKNPLLIYKIRVQSTIENIFRPDLISMNRHSLKNSLVRESRMMLPLSFMDVRQFQETIVDIPTAFGLDYASNISYVIQPKTTLNLSLFCIPYNKAEHEKLQKINSDGVKGHPIWITNKSDKPKDFTLFSSVKDYTNEQLIDNDLDFMFWETRMDIQGLVDNLFVHTDTANFSFTRVFSKNKEQLNTNIEYSCGDGNVKSVKPIACLGIEQFMTNFIDVPENVFDTKEKRILNLYYSDKKLHPSYIKTVIAPNTTVCIWVETFKD